MRIPERVLLPRGWSDDDDDDEGFWLFGEGLFVQELSPAAVLLYKALSKMENSRCIHLDLRCIPEGEVQIINDTLRKSGCVLEELGVRYAAESGMTLYKPGLIVRPMSS